MLTIEIIVMQKPFDIPGAIFIDVIRLIGKTDGSSAFNTPAVETITSSVLCALQSTQLCRITRITTMNVFANTFHLFRSKFENINYRGDLMDIVCCDTKSNDYEFQLFGLRCLKNIVVLHYRFMNPYMNAIIQLICKNFQEGAGLVRLEVMKLFKSICEHEKELAILSQEIRDTEHLPNEDDVSRDYIQNARAELAPKLMDLLIYQEVQTDNNSKEMIMDCVREFFTVCDDEYVIPIGISFINDNIPSENSSCREGALRALSLLVECVSMSRFIHYIDNKMQTLIDFLMDQNTDIHTRIITVDVFAKIFKNFPEALRDITDMKIDNIFKALLLNLDSDPHLTPGVCTVLIGMSNALYQKFSIQKDQVFDENSYFNRIVEKVFKSTNSIGFHQSSLFVAVYEALSEIVNNMSSCCNNIVQITSHVILNQTIEYIGIISKNSNQIVLLRAKDILPSLLRVLKCTIEKSNRPEAISIYDDTMGATIRVLEIDTPELEDAKINALMTIASLSDIIGNLSDIHIERVRPILLMALKAHHNVKVCSSAIQLVGVIARCNQFCLRNCGPMLSVFYQHLKTEGVSRSLKSEIIRVLRDVSQFTGCALEMNQFHIIARLHHSSPALQTSSRAHNSLIEIIKKQNVSAFRIGTMKTINDNIKRLEDPRLSDTEMKHCIDAFIYSLQHFDSTIRKHNDKMNAATSVINLSA